MTLLGRHGIKVEFFIAFFLLSVRTPRKDKIHACMNETLETQTKVLEALPLEVLPERIVTMHPES